MDAAAAGIDEILRSLEEGIRDFMDSDRYKTYLKAVGRFHDYSTNNIMLISMQRPDATLVAGYSTWKNGFKRHVKKGEKGIRIIAPVPVKVEKEKDVSDRYGNVTKEKVLVTIPRFRTVTVFDVSQTEGEPLPSIDPKILDGTVEDYWPFLTALERSSIVPVRYAEIQGDAKGYYDSRKNEICIRKDMSQAQTVKTLVHEMAHSLLHNRSSGGMDLPARTKEVEAESVAFTVCSYFGIDTSDYTFPYVAGWSGETETKALKESLDTIRDTSSMLIHEIEDSFREIKRDMEVSGLAEDILDLQRGDDASVNMQDADGAALSSVIRQLRDGHAQTVISVLRERYRDETDPDKKEKISSLMRRAEALRKDTAQTDRERKEMER